jgi:hypothetical protein
MAVSPAFAGTNFTVGSNPLGKDNGLKYRSALNDNVSGSPGFAVATCPGERVLTGGGSFVNGPTSEAWIVDSGPQFIAEVTFPPREAWTAAVLNDSGGPKDVTGYAICGKPSGMKFRKETGGPTSPNAPFSLKTKCPAGTSVTGGGFNSEDSSDQLLVSAPFDSGDRRGRPDDGWRLKIIAGGNKRMVRVWAICSETLDLAYRDSEDNAPGGAAFEGARCPADASLTGGGVSLSGNAGGFINTSFPGDTGQDSDSVPDNQWGSHAHVGSGSRTLTAYAICKT